MKPVLRLIAMLPFVLFASACSTLKCDEPRPYHASRLGEPLRMPEGSASLPASTAYDIPGSPPPPGYTGGGCLQRPPMLVPDPLQEEEEEEETESNAEAAGSDTATN